MFYLKSIDIDINNFSINPDTWVELNFGGSNMGITVNKEGNINPISDTTIATEEILKRWATLTKQKKEPHFGGAWYNREGALISIKEVKYNNPVTVVFWSDGTKTTSKCQKGDVYSKETGLTICVLKKLKNNDWFQKLINDWVPTDDKTTQIALKDLRKKERGPHYTD